MVTYLSSFGRCCAIYGIFWQPHYGYFGSQGGIFEFSAQFVMELAMAAKAIDYTMVTELEKRKNS
jgi:hypothetical protein